MLADKLSLFFSYFLFDCRVSCLRGAIKYIKTYSVPLALHLCQNAVFFAALCFNAYIVLCNTHEHILALADINNIIVDLNAVNSRVFVFGCKPFPL